MSDALAQSSLPPGQLALELTETAVMNDVERATTVLHALRRLGVNISIDDFGTGYSSLTYLKRVPADRLKIDRSFVGGIGEGGDDDAIVASIVSLADKVGLACVAEGVETTDQLVALHLLGCRFAQGYLWSEPVPAAEFVARLAVPVVDVSGRGRARRESWFAQLDPATSQRLLTLHREGASLQTIAAALNRMGSRTPLGARWHSASVARVVAEAGGGTRRVVGVGT